MTSRRDFLAGAGAVVTAPAVVRAQQPLTLGFLTIPDPDGWHPSLRLKGDWLVFEISDGLVSGYGEASHSRDDEACRRAATRLFAEHYRDFEPRLEWLAGKERELAALEPDFVTATALSGINQACYELIAKREQVPVWQLFGDRPGIDRLPLYTTINRALQQRTNAEYLDIVGQLERRRFASFKCAPFEAVDSPDGAYDKSAAGRGTLSAIRAQFPEIGIRVDFHERFLPDSLSTSADSGRCSMSCAWQPGAPRSHRTTRRDRSRRPRACTRLPCCLTAFAHSNMRSTAPDPGA